MTRIRWRRNPHEQADQTELVQRFDEQWPFYSSDEIEAVVSVLRSGKVNQWTGSEVFAFENACRAQFQVEHGIAVANGSVALELALRALRIGPGDEVIVTPRSFVASAFCVLLVGATPVFADVDCDSGNVSAATIEEVITERTRAIIAVHLAGWPADMPSIMKLASRRSIAVVEDCAQSPGAAMGGRPAGSFGDAAAFSFCQDKIISTGGEGGFVCFKDRAAYEWAWSFKDHGKNRERALTPAKDPAEFRWLHDSVGTNWRMTGMQAAIGLAQIRKLDEWVHTREQNARIWVGALRDLPHVRIPLPPEHVRAAWYKLYFYLDVGDGQSDSLRTRISQQAREEGIRLFTGSCSEIYREAAFQHLPQPDCPIARHLGETSFMVEVHPTLRTDLLQRRAERLSQIFRDALN